ncbi:MAG: hypothetical protein HC897_16060 [Thermoanaerobaculia bacterium]|nr:hypothetical protein [Thermoanaerobaculia bacterium]
MHDVHRLLRTAFVFALWLGALVPHRAAGLAGLTLHPTDGLLVPIASHAIGDDLWVGLQGAAPGRVYSLELRDESGWVVASVQVDTDRFGSVLPTLLWSHSGVVGCDPGANPDPSSYRFDDFDQAEAFLGGRVFSLFALDSTRSDVAKMSLPLDVRTTPMIYVGDASGCPRWTFAIGDDVHALVKTSPQAQSARIWIVPLQADWMVGDPLVDLRPDYPEGLVVTLTPELHETWQLAGLLWDDPPEGSFCAVFQLFPGAQPALMPWIRDVDIVNQGAIQCAAIYGLAHDEPW